MDGPVGIDGLHEDVSGADLPPVLYACQLALDMEKNKSKPQYHEIYRYFAPRLREIINGPFFGKDEAQSLLRKLYLEQTLPENELHNPDWIDSYTGDPVVDIMEDRELIVEELQKTEDLLPEWQRFLANRMPYEDQVMANRFIEANWEYPGQEEEVLFEEDRGYEPDHFEVNYEGRPDQDLPEAWRRTFEERQHLSEVIEKTKVGLNLPYDCWKIREAVVKEGEGFLAQLQQMLNEGMNPANVAMVFMRWQHGLGFDAEHAEHLSLPAQWHDKIGTNLRDFINEYWEELSESLDACGPAFARGPVSDAEIDGMTEGWLEDYLEAIPIEAPIRRSRWFCEGYIKAVLAGNPRPQDEGMTNWRQKTSAAGSKAYDEAIKNGATQRQAMGVYWKFVKRPGIQMPKKVVAIKPSGLRLASGRFVAWGIAIRIAKEEGFDDQERLKEVLVSRNWGQALVAAL